MCISWTNKEITISAYVGEKCRCININQYAQKKLI